MISALCGLFDPLPGLLTFIGRYGSRTRETNFPIYYICYIYLGIYLLSTTEKGVFISQGNTKGLIRKWRKSAKIFKAIIRTRAKHQSFKDSDRPESDLQYIILGTYSETRMFLTKKSVPGGRKFHD